MEMFYATRRLFQRTAEIVISTVSSIREWLSNARIFIYPPELSEDNTDLQYGISFDECDEEFILKSSQILRECFTSHPIDRLLEMNVNDRIEYTELMITQLLQLYELRGVNIRFVNSASSAICGGYSYSEKTIELNIAELATDNSTLIQDYLDTIFHELRHAVQWHAMETFEREQYRWGNDEKKVKEYAKGFAFYIPASQDPEGYYNQYVERESRAIAAAILKYAEV